MITTKKEVKKEERKGQRKRVGERHRYRKKERDKTILNDKKTGNGDAIFWRFLQQIWKGLEIFISDIIKKK